MAMITHNVELRKIAQQIRENSFVDDYVATDEECLGLALAWYFQWDGEKILETTISALEDSNWHTECEEIGEMIIRSKDNRINTV